MLYVLLLIKIQTYTTGGEVHTKRTGQDQSKQDERNNIISPLLFFYFYFWVEYNSFPQLKYENIISRHMKHVQAQTNEIFVVPKIK